MAILTKTVKTGKGIGRFLGFLFKFRFLFFFVLFILINSIILGVQAKSVEPVINDLGERFLTPTLTLQDQSQEIIANEGIFFEDKGAFKNGVDIFLFIVDLLTEIWIVLIWVGVLTWLITKILLGDQISLFIRSFFAILIFLGVQALYISQTNQGTIMTPLLAFKDFFRATVFIIGPLAGVAEVFIKNVENKTIEVLNETTINFINKTNLTSFVV